MIRADVPTAAPDWLSVWSLGATIALGFTSIVIALLFDRRARSSQRGLDKSLGELRNLVGGMATDLSLLTNVSAPNFERGAAVREAGAREPPERIPTADEVLAELQRIEADSTTPAEAGRLVDAFGEGNLVVRSIVRTLLELRLEGRVRFTDAVLNRSTQIHLNP